MTSTRVHQDARAAPLRRGHHQSTGDTHQRTQHYCTAAPVAHACACSMRAPPFSILKKKARQNKTNTEKKKRKENQGGKEERQNHQPHTPTAHSAHSGEQAVRGRGHRTRTCTEGSKGTGHHGLHPQGRTHWDDQANPAGQWQERYSKAAGRARPGCIRDHGKHRPEPWKQLTTGVPAHSPGRGRLPSSGAPQLEPQG